MNDTPPSSSPHPKQQIVSGAIQTVASTYVGRAVSFGATILLMRMLPEALFGTTAFAVSVLTIVVSLRNLGLHYALLHNHDQVDEFAPTHFVLNLLTGGIGTLALIALAVLAGGPAQISATFLPWHSGRTGPSPEASSQWPLVLVAFALLEFLRNAAFTSEVQLRRDLKFGRLAFAHASSTVAAAAVALVLAYRGWGLWSLVLGYSVNSATYIVFYCVQLFSRRPPPLNRLTEVDPVRARALLGYGLWYWIGGVMQAVVLQFDRIVVGVLQGVADLGFYERAHVFAQMPTGAVTHAIVGVTGTVYARYQHERDKLSAAYRRTLRLIVRSTVLLSVLLVGEARGLTLLAVGEDWFPMVPMLRWLILFSICRPILDDIHALLQGVGDLRGIARFVLAEAVLLVIVAPVTTREYGAVGAAVAMDASALLGLTLAIRRVRRHVDVPWVRTLLPPVAAGATAGGMRIVADPLLTALTPVLEVAAGFLLMGCTYAVVLAAIEGKRLLYELNTLWTAVRFKGRMR